MTARTLFVTGTDTEVGKTRISTALLRGLRGAGQSAVGYKPVASGCVAGAEGLRNEDALALQAAGTPGWGYDAINPYAFGPAIAPHIAAADAGTTVDRAVLDAGHDALAAASDWVVVEGAGGWYVPLSDTLDFADWVAARGWPVLLVVGMRLGCVNHALLSAHAIAARTGLVGWIANTLPPEQPRLAANLACLEARMPAPLVARVGMDPAPDFTLNPALWFARTYP
ncbi:dithiobiotin synthetase [Salinisphaera orenii MK-B5]|uniref:ATP-dependent dethiobiotin synthetase BioD n=1 Tax=Salinisphaera orenii MK-B5 TaxID=856730 RepID=A0A423PQB8_9GAMM|nr:dethiobiotin synthase [Salinisphaera orenii]ROO27816.1 dithiobiotin synthetase [Salinisphaera orenii MK-B5]